VFKMILPLIYLLPLLIFTNNQYAIIETCTGSWLERMGEIKQFVSHVMPSFNKVEWKQSYNTVPVLIIYDNNSKEIEKINLINKTSEECASLLLKRGFRNNTFIDFFKNTIWLFSKMSCLLTEKHLWIIEAKTCYDSIGK